MDRMLLAKRIISYRKKKHWSQEDLAFHSNCARTTIGRIERGEITATLESIMKIEEALGLPQGALLRPANPSIRTPLTDDKREQILREFEFKLKKEKIPSDKDLIIVVSIQLEEKE